MPVNDFHMEMQVVVTATSLDKSTPPQDLPITETSLAVSVLCSLKKLTSTPSITPLSQIHPPLLRGCREFLNNYWNSFIFSLPICHQITLYTDHRRILWYASQSIGKRLL